MLEAQGSVLTNKYAEGYPGRRYYGGCEFVDVAEQLAIDRAKRLFGCAFANVQPHSGSQANQAVLLALLQPGDTIMGMSLAAGGHLTHGAPPNLSGKWFRAVQYGVRREDGRIDYRRGRAPGAGGTSPSSSSPAARPIRASSTSRASASIADAVGAYLMVDMAHFAGLVAGGVHPSPLPHAHVVTTTTHKTLRGPRGGMILANDEEIGKKINSAVFPGLQGGPLMHVIAAKAVMLGEALRPEFKLYARAVVDNAQGAGGDAGGARPRHRLGRHRHASDAGRSAAEEAHRQGRRSRRSSAPASPATRTAFRSIPEKPTVTSGIRLGSPAATTRGFGQAEFRQVGELIAEVLDGLAGERRQATARSRRRCGARCAQLCARFPVYPLSRPAETAREGEEQAHALSVLRLRGYPGQGFAADRRPRARSAAGGSAPIAPRASPPSSGCSCAS